MTDEWDQRDPTATMTVAVSPITDAAVRLPTTSRAHVREYDAGAEHAGTTDG